MNIKILLSLLLITLTTQNIQLTAMQETQEKMSQIDNALQTIKAKQILCRESNLQNQALLQQIDDLNKKIQKVEQESEEILGLTEKAEEEKNQAIKEKEALEAKALALNKTLTFNKAKEQQKIQEANQKVTEAEQRIQEIQKKNAQLEESLNSMTLKNIDNEQELNKCKKELLIINQRHELDIKFLRQDIDIQTEQIKQEKEKLKAQIDFFHQTSNLRVTLDEILKNLIVIKNLTSESLKQKLPAVLPANIRQNLEGSTQTLVNTVRQLTDQRSEIINAIKQSNIANKGKLIGAIEGIYSGFGAQTGRPSSFFGSSPDSSSSSSGRSSSSSSSSSSSRP